MSVINLSARELEVGRLVCEGVTTTEIARRLKVSTGTVWAHRTGLRLKLRARNTPEVIGAMIQRNLWRPPPLAQ